MHRLTLLCHGPTSATRRAAFPLDEPIELPATEQAAALRARLGRVDAAIAAPALRTRQTAEALGLAASEAAALRDLDCGRWGGRTIGEIQGAEPAALEAWMLDESSSPHGGESRASLRSRVAAWLHDREVGRGHTVAVTHAAVIRSALMIVLDASATAFWRIDVAPWSLAALRFDSRRWAVRSIEPP